MKLFMRTFQLARLTGRARGQTGGLLIETVVALTVFGVLGSVVLSGVQTSFISKRNFDSQSVAENLVRNQMEYVLEQTYKGWPDTYSAVTSTPAGYSIVAKAVKYATSTDSNISTIEVTVYHEGQPVKVFETIRTNR